MSLDDTLARMRQKATSPGAAEAPVHLLAGKATGEAARWATFAGYACTGDWSLTTALYQRTKNPDRVTCPDCLASVVAGSAPSGGGRAISDAVLATTRGASC